MDNNSCVLFELDICWFHKAAAIMRAVAWVDINMFAPQALWAVIRVSIAVNTSVAVFAYKVFNSAGEFFCHISYRKPRFREKWKICIFVLHFLLFL